MGKAYWLLPMALLKFFDVRTLLPLVMPTLPDRFGPQIYEIAELVRNSKAPNTTSC